MVVLEYLRDYFTHRTVFGESCKDFWSELKYFKPLLHKKSRKEIWPDFKKSVDNKKKGNLLKWKLKAILAVVLFICTIFTGNPWLRAIFILIAIFLIAVCFINYWQLRKILHEVDQDLRKKNRTTKPAAQTSAASRSPAVGTKNRPNSSGITPRRKPLH